MHIFRTKIYNLLNSFSSEISNAPVTYSPPTFFFNFQLIYSRVPLHTRILFSLPTLPTNLLKLLNNFALSSFSIGPYTTIDLNPCKLEVEPYHSRSYIFELNHNTVTHIIQLN